MPVYKYSALNEHNEMSKGQIDASSVEEVRQILNFEGKKLIRIKRDFLAKSASGKITFKKISTSEIAAFCKQLCIITRSGITIHKGLIMVRDQAMSSNVRILAHNLSVSIQKGCSLSEAFRICGFRLPLLLINMVKVGEASGNLDDIFKKMAKYYEDETRVRKKIISALIYPCILVCVSIGVIIIFTFFVLPDLTEVITDSGAELPLITKMLMGSSRFIADNIYAVIGALVLIFVLYAKVVPLEFKSKLKEELIFKTPMISKVAVDFLTARIARTMGILINTGLPMLTIMDTLEKVAGNEKLARGLSTAKDKINKGESLSVSFAQMDFFDTMVTNIISISEEAGNLGDSLIDIADYYEEKFEAGISKAISMLEPTFTLIMGGVIAAILLSVMLPMFNMIGTLSNSQ